MVTRQQLWRLRLPLKHEDSLGLAAFRCVLLCTTRIGEGHRMMCGKWWWLTLVEGASGVKGCHGEQGEPLELMGSGQKVRSHNVKGHRTRSHGLFFFFKTVDLNAFLRQHLSVCLSKTGVSQSGCFACLHIAYIHTCLCYNLSYKYTSYQHKELKKHSSGEKKRF